MELDFQKPTPKKNESQTKFVARCIPIVIAEGTAQEAAVGKCFGIFSSSKKKKKAFNSVDQLPEEVKQLPNLAQKLWLSIFNSLESLGKSQIEASAGAWKKVKTKWEFDTEANAWKLKDGALEKGINLMEIVNTTSDLGNFKAWIPLDMDGGFLNIIEKDVEGKSGHLAGKKKKFLQGTASNTQVDKENERVSAEFIQKMKESALGLTVFLEHQHTLDKTLGIISAVGGDDDNFDVETMLEPEEDNENVKMVLSKASNGIRLGYSIGGRISRITKELDVELGREIVNLEDGELLEVSVTPMPAGQDTWTTTIVKSMRKLVKNYEEHEVDSSKEKLIANFEAKQKLISDYANGKKKGMKNRMEEVGIKENVLKYLVSQLEKDRSNLNGLVCVMDAIIVVNKAVSAGSLDEANLSEEELSKALEEMVQADEIKSVMRDFWWSFQDAMHLIVFNDDLAPEEKGEKINLLSGEFSAKIAELSSQLASLVETIDEELS